MIDAAAMLFARHGVRSVGVGAIITSAGVARASFYRYFPSKNDLIAEWLRSSQARWLDEVRVETERRAATPRARLTVFFEVLGEWLAAGAPRGCPFLSTSAELRDSTPAVRAALVEALDDVEGYLRDQAAAAGLTDPRSVGARLRVISAGVMALSLALPDRTVATAGAQTARLVVDGAA